MVRIGGSTEKGKHIKEWDYYSPSGEFRVDSGGSPTMLNSLMYKLCYYNFGKVYSEASRFLCELNVIALKSYAKHYFYHYVFVLDKASGYDRVRNSEIGNKYFELDKLEEAYTTEHWLVRIYKVKDLNNKGL